jgi:phage tail-like protein
MADDNEHALNYVTPNRFYVQVGSDISAYFSECSGPEAKIKHTPYMEGGVNDQQRICLGQTTFTDITLKRGLTNDPSFWEWVRGKFNRRNVTILTFNQAGVEMQSWTLIGAVPVAWKAPLLKAADSNTVAIEELKLAYEGLKVQSKFKPKSGEGKTSDVWRNERSGSFSSN